MNLNLPLSPTIEGINRCLLIGAGGGFDILGAYPIRDALTACGKSGVADDLHERLGRRCGVQPLLELMRHATEGVNGIIVVDGGVDSLMRGDEQDAGTLLDDAVTLCAAAHLDVPHKVLACVGFGTEVEEGVCHYRALENISALVAAGGFLGACALTPAMESFARYKEACERHFELRGRKSHIHTRIIPAVLGHFGAQAMYEGVDARVLEASSKEPFVNPLMGIYWFFDLMKVYERNLFAARLLPTNTGTDALQIYRQCLPDLMKNRRPSQPIPL